MEHLQIELPEKYKNVINDATIEIVDGNLIITPKKQEFKDGDILVIKNERTCVFIYNGNGNYTTSFYVARWDGKELDIEGTERALALEGNSDVDYATKEEKQKLFDALDKSGKKWNQETKQIEDILKVGDLAIFWDDDKSKAIISIVCEVYLLQPVPYISACGRFFNAIKCTSLEQYINFIK